VTRPSRDNTEKRKTHLSLFLGFGKLFCPFFSTTLKVLPFCLFKLSIFSMFLLFSTLFQKYTIIESNVGTGVVRSLNPGIDTIGVRVPDCEFIRKVSRGSGSVLALTSANLSGDRSSVCVNDFQSLWQHCACVYDGGLLPLRRAGSTIVDLTKVGKYKVIRPGSAKQETLAILEKYLLEEE
ncbi:hypothetical protein HID58_009018, partial [Brassica napus]